jgi:uncharacterized protein (TIGR02271 family)
MSDPQTWIGAAVAGARGELLGHVGAVYFDNATGRPAWAAVQGPRHTAVVPLELSRFDGTTLHVPFGADRLRSAPHHHPSTQISHRDGEDLYRHYGIGPTPQMGPPDVGPTGAVGAGAPGLRPGEAADPAEEGEMIRSEERLRVGTETVRVGRARLVKYLVTEDVTYTVPVSREEVRLEYEHLSEPEHVIAGTAPAEETYEVTRYEERVLFTKQTVAVERVRMVKRVVTTEQAVTGQVRAEHIDVHVLDAQQGEQRPGRS